MLGKYLLLASLAALVGLCSGSPAGDDSEIIQLPAPLVGTDVVLKAFQNMGYQPESTLQDENGTIYQWHYAFDEDEWDAMHDKLYLEQGGNVTDLVSTPLDTRAPKWVCKGFTKFPAMYSITMGTVAGFICSGLQGGALYAGKKQVIKRTTNANGEHFYDRLNNKVAMFLSATWYVAQMGSSSACGAALSYGISYLCTEMINGDKGSQKGTQGFKETYTGPKHSTWELHASTEL